MSNMDYIRSMLQSKNIDSTNVKPYTGLHFNASGDLILTTPSLDSSRVNHEPMFRYQNLASTPRLPLEIDYRIWPYESLETQRHKTLHLKSPTPRHVSRIFEERFGQLEPIQVDPSKTVTTEISPGYRILVNQIARQNQTMVSQRFNKWSPFVTEDGNN